jgi:hypothetical protein
VTTGEVENGGTNGAAPHTPPGNTGTVVIPGGSPSEEVSTAYTPVLASIAPTTVVHGIADAVVTCTGTGFFAGTVAKVNGVDQVTTYVSPTSVTYVGKHSLQAGAGALPVTVVNGTLTSVARTFTYT